MTSGKTVNWSVRKTIETKKKHKPKNQIVRCRGRCVVYLTDISVYNSKSSLGAKKQWTMPLHPQSVMTIYPILFPFWEHFNQVMTPSTMPAQESPFGTNPYQLCNSGQKGTRGALGCFFTSLSFSVCYVFKSRICFCNHFLLF